MKVRLYCYCSALINSPRLTDTPAPKFINAVMMVKFKYRRKYISFVVCHKSKIDYLYEDAYIFYKNSVYSLQVT